MDELPLARLLSAAAQHAITQLNERLAAEGHPDARPAFGYALLAVGADGATASELAGHLGITKQAVAKLAARLEALGYLERRAHDRDARAQLLLRTPRADDLLARAERIQRELEQEWAERAGPRRMATARAALEAATSDSERRTLRPLW